MVMETLVESSHGGRRTLLQYIKMLLVIAVPVIAIVCLVGYTVHNSRVERASQQAAVEQFQLFADIEALETSMRAESDYTTSVVILGGQDADANEVMFKQRSHTDYILFSLPAWPHGLASVDDHQLREVHLASRTQLMDKLNALRGKVATMSIDFHDVLDFYGDITTQLMYWLLVIYFHMTFLTFSTHSISFSGAAN